MLTRPLSPEGNFTRNLSGREAAEGHVRGKLKLISVRFRDVGETAMQADQDRRR